MGVCFSCCGHDSHDGTHQQGRLSRNRNQSAENPGTTMMDECSIPVQYSLGQRYPRFNTAPISESVSSISSDSTNFKGHKIKGELKRIAITWNSPVSLTFSQLEQKRLEFWETAPAYGGSPEVWQALRNAVEIGHNDIETARIILSCAGITTPTGTLTEAYDDLGYRYSIPPYCLADPTNGLTAASSNENDPTFIKDYDDLSTLGDCLPTHSVKIRLSSGNDITLSIPSSPTICIGHLRKILRDHLRVEGRVEFFWSGHGPLPQDTKLSSLGDLSGLISPLLQAWIFPTVLAI